MYIINSFSGTATSAIVQRTECEGIMADDTVRVGDYICLYCEDTLGYIFSVGSRYVPFNSSHWMEGQVFTGCAPARIYSFFRGVVLKNFVK